MADPVAPDSGASRRPPIFSRSVSVEDDLARLDPAGRADEAQDRQAGHALPAAGLADEPHDLAPVDVEVDAVDRPDHAIACREGRPEAAYVEQPAAPWLRGLLADGGTSSSMTASL